MTTDRTLRRLVIVLDVRGGDPDRLEDDVRAWGQDQRFRALAGRAGASVEDIHALLVPVTEVPRHG